MLMIINKIQNKQIQTTLLSESELDLLASDSHAHTALSKALSIKKNVTHKINYV